VASGESAREALAQARAHGYAQPIFTRMPEERIPFVGAYEVYVETLKPKWMNVSRWAPRSHPATTQQRTMPQSTARWYPSVPLEPRGFA
jgi:hypothetical protein